MARPRIYPTRIQITVILNKEEEDALRNKAYGQGSDVSRFVRKLILNDLNVA